MDSSEVSNARLHATTMGNVSVELSLIDALWHITQPLFERKLIDLATKSKLSVHSLLGNAKVGNVEESLVTKSVDKRL